MAKRIVAGMPVDADLGSSWRLRVNAVDPTTGAAVAGVVVTDFSLLCLSIGAGAIDDLAYGPFMLVPGPGAA